MSSTTSSNTAFPYERIVLPDHVIPRHYDLTIQPDLVQCTFQGQVQVTLDVNKSFKQIVCNAAEIEVKQVTVLQQQQLIASSAQITYNEEEEQVTFDLDAEVDAAKYPQVVLAIKYTGILNDKMRGFYQSKYTNKNGEKKIMGVTQFEACDARRALPCWDEPALKATFGVTLIAPADRVSISNMPEKHSETLAETTTEGVPLVKKTFENTPLMSTYLLAWVIGEFDILSTEVDNVLIRVFTPVGRAHEGKFALEVAGKTLAWYNQYFQIPYPLPKLDLVAIPDFAAGAMENWGLTTYRETALLHNEKESSASTKQWVAIVVAHEISHQWFGNLTTMDWWDGLWLNEGMASYFENFSVHSSVSPDWNLWEQFVSSDFNSALELDSLRNSHPIQVPIKSASEVDEIFDVISYSKGCVVVRMLVNYLGDEIFRKGMMTYFQRFPYKNVSTNDLWQTLAEVSGKDVSGIMSAWTLQTGFPVVTLKELSRGNGKIVYSVTQSRFLQDGIDSSDNSLWPIPITFLCEGKSGPQSPQIFKERSGELVLDVGDHMPAWVKINADQTAFIRVIYPEPMLNELCAAVAIQPPVLAATDRLGIQNDAFALTKASLLPTVQLLNIVKGYKNEKDYTVCADIASNLSALASVLKQHDETYELFSKFVRNLFKDVLNHVGWEKKANESHTDALLRSKIIAVCGKYGDESIIKTAVDKFSKFFTSTIAKVTSKTEATSSSTENTVAVEEKVEDDAHHISPDLRSAVYALAVAHGSEYAYHNMHTLLTHSTLSEERVRIMTALGHAKDTKLLNSTLEFALSDKVRSQDASSIISAVAHNRLGAQLTWDFLKANWGTIVERFGGTMSMSRLVSTTEALSSYEAAQDVEEFFKTHPAPAAERAVKQAVEVIRNNAAWWERDGAAITAWLKENSDF